MQIAYHVGVHGTDHELIVRTLLRNRETLLQQGIHVPPPNRYRGVFGEAIASLKGAPATPEMQEVLLDSLIDDGQAHRIVLSQSGFLGMPKRAVVEGAIYGKGPDRIAGLSQLFPNAEVEFFVCLMHPALLVDSVASVTDGGYAQVMGNVDPLSLRWAPTLRAMVQAAPGRRFVVWCQEDLPFVWPELLHRMAAVGPSVPLVGEMALLSEMLPPERIEALRAELDKDPTISVLERRAMIEAELSLHGRDEVMMRAIDLPGWTQEILDELTEDYHEDMAEIAAISGVETLTA